MSVHMDGYKSLLVASGKLKVMDYCLVNFHLRFDEAKHN